MHVIYELCCASCTVCDAVHRLDSIGFRFESEMATEHGQESIGHISVVEPFWLCPSGNPFALGPHRAVYRRFLHQHTSV
jgi:hypothetical protein